MTVEKSVWKVFVVVLYWDCPNILMKKNASPARTLLFLILQTALANNATPNRHSVPSDSPNQAIQMSNCRQGQTLAAGWHCLEHVFVDKWLLLV